MNTEVNDLPPQGSPTDPAPAPSVTSAVPPKPARSWPSSLLTALGWLVTLVVIGVGVSTQEQWLPQVRALVEKEKPAARKEERVIPVTTAAVRTRDVPLYLNGLGTVTAFRTVTIRSRVDGELVHVRFTEGEMVEAGKLLAEIDPRPFEVQLAQAEGQLARDEAILKTAKLTLSRYEELLPSRAVTAQQLDEQATIVQQTAATIKTSEAMVANARLQLSYCKIEAPIAGRIGLRQVDQGNIVVANDPLGIAVITQLQPIAVIFTIPQDEIARVQQRVRTEKDPLPVTAFDRNFQNELAQGGLLAIDNQVDATTGTVRIKAEFKNEDGMLFPNQFVNARLLVDTRRGVKVVPTAAIQRGPASMFVYVVRDDNTVETRDVETGPAEGIETIIESGLEVGEIVATDGLDKLQPKAKVAPRGKGDKNSPAPPSEAPKPASDSAAPESTDPRSRRPTPQTAASSGEPERSDGESRSKPATSCTGADDDMEAKSSNPGGRP